MINDPALRLPNTAARPHRFVDGGIGGNLFEKQDLVEGHPEDIYDVGIERSGRTFGKAGKDIVDAPEISQRAVGDLGGQGTVFVR